MSAEPADLVILVPTRLRPHAVLELARAFADTATAGTEIRWCVDGCPRAEQYYAQFERAYRIYPHMTITAGPRRKLVGTLNHYGVWLAHYSDGQGTDPPLAIGYLGDDHRPRTAGWDEAYLTALRDLGSGIVHGDDEHHGAGLPTQMAMTADIIRALGHVAPMALTHMYCDNYWRDLGQGAGCLRYLPDVVITHCHPGVGRGEWDASYHESNSAGQYETDRIAYEAHRQYHLAGEIAAVRALRAAAGGEPRT